MATATAWVRSLSCKSTAVADDVCSPPPKKHPPMPGKDSAALLPNNKESRRSRSMEQDRPARRRKKKTKDKSELARKSAKQFQASPMASSPKRPSPGSFLEMTELPEGHPSRRVVEIIFASGWAFAHDDAPVPDAEVEAVFRVRSTPRTVARFEDARRDAMLARGADARCAADGNEMMRFQCRAPEADGTDQVICAAVATTTTGPSSSAVRTFAGSGVAHAGAGGGALEGRRGVLVCRVIAGRVRQAADDPACSGGEHDSVEAGGGELVVLDRRAVLPCFLVVYRVKPALDRSSTSRRHSRCCSDAHHGLDLRADHHHPHSPNPLTVS